MAYRLGETRGIAVWCEDEAGPYQAVPHPGASWRPVGQPARQPHEYVRGGTAKLLTLFRPATGEVRAKGVPSAPNAVLHPWLQAELTAILATLPVPPAPEDPTATRAAWVIWQAGLSRPITLPAALPPLRLLLVLDNLAGHLTPAFVLWLFAHGVLPLYTPLSGSWLNMAEALQRIIVGRALAGQQPHSQADLITWLEEAVAGWNAAPTPFVWGGKRRERRHRARQRRLGGSAATLHDYQLIAA
jgi:hypothetical protein